MSKYKLSDRDWYIENFNTNNWFSECIIEVRLLKLLKSDFN